MSGASHILVLIAPPGGEGLTPAFVEAVAAALPRSGTPSWLTEGAACDIPFTLDDPEKAREIEEAVRKKARVPLDAAVLSARSPRRKKLFVADMESTLIQEECLDELAGVAGKRDEISAITAKAMRGEIPFEGALSERVARLAGLSEVEITALRDGGLHFTPGARTLMATLKRHGVFTVLVSGGFSCFAAPIAGALGFDAWQANHLEIAHGKLTGRVLHPILGPEAKLQALLRFSEERGVSPQETLAVGDGANDLPMISAAGLGIAFHAKPVVAAEAPARILHGDLTAILYLQGYRREEFAA